MWILSWHSAVSRWIGFPLFQKLSLSIISDPCWRVLLSSELWSITSWHANVSLHCLPCLLACQMCIGFQKKESFVSLKCDMCWIFDPFSMWKSNRFCSISNEKWDCNYCYCQDLYKSQLFSNHFEIKTVTHFGNKLCQ